MDSRKLSRRSLVLSSAAASTASLLSLPKTAQAKEGYRRCDQLHPRFIETQVERWKQPLLMPSLIKISPLTKETTPIVGKVNQGVAPEWYWSHPTPETEKAPHIGAGDTKPRPNTIYGADTAPYFCELNAHDFLTELIPGFLTRRLGYGAKCADGKYKISSPGPLFEVKLGQQLIVRVRNKINPKLALDVSVHLHGGHTPAHSDGHPNFLVRPHAHFTKKGKEEARDYYYPNPVPLHVDKNADPQEGKWDMAEVPSTMWYHDHANDITAHNALMGLNGFYFLRDEKEETWMREGKLPPQEREIALALQDICLERIVDPKLMDREIAQKVQRQENTDSGNRLIGEARIHFDPFDHNGSLGNLVLVNGRPFPVHALKDKGRFRFRILNGSLARFYDLVFLRVNRKTGARHMINFHRIGKDSWLVKHPIPTNSAFLGMANRADILIDFSSVGGDDDVYLVSRLDQKDGRGPGHGDNVVDPEGQPRGDQFTPPEDEKDILWLLKLTFQSQETPSPSPVPTELREHELIPSPRKDQRYNVRVFNFERRQGAWQINHQFFDECTANAVPELWHTELWILRNRSGGWWHPIHIHLESHQQIYAAARTLRGKKLMIKRSDYEPDALHEDSTLWLDDEGEALDKPDQDDPTQKRQEDPFAFDPTVWNLDIKHDTTILGPNTEVHILMRYRTFRGPFVFHCHNLNHEDMRMMFQFDPRPHESGGGQAELPVEPAYWFFTSTCDHKENHR